MPAKVASHVRYRQRERKQVRRRDITAGTSHMSALRGQAESVSPVHTTITGFHMENSLLMGQVPGAG